MSSLLQDVRFALRLFRRTPAVTAAALVSLAIGIGANAAIFSVIEALGFRPLAVSDEASLVRVSAASRESRGGALSYPEFQEIRSQARAFSSVLAHGMRASGLTDPHGDTEVVLTDVVSGDYFSTLGVRPALGRLLRPDDELPASPPVVVISHSLWQRRFAGDPSVVGRPLTVSGVSCTLAGVAPADFRGLATVTAPELWLPFGTWMQLGANQSDLGPRSRWLEVTGRLRPGATLDRASAEMATIAARLAESRPDTNKGRSASVLAETAARRGGFALIGLMLFAVVGLVLLIACANVAGLLLGRAEARRHEIGVRLAIGAGRGRLLRQLLIESTVLSLAAALAAWLLASWVVRLLPALLPPMPFRMGITFDLNARILLVTLGLSLAAAVVSGLAPALVAARTSVLPALRGEANRRRARRVGGRDLLVVAQVALSAMLLVGAGLVVRSLVNSQAVDPGFDTSRRLLVATMSLRPPAGTPDAARAFYRDMVERAAALPDVEAAAMANRIPLSTFGGGATEEVVVPGVPIPADQGTPRIGFAIVDDRYFQLMGTRIVRGRAFVPEDVSGPGVVVISEAMARRFWPGADAIGARLQIGEGKRETYEVVGVAQDGKYASIGEETRPYFYCLWGQRRSGDTTLLLRVRGSERAAAEQLRAMVRHAAPGTPMLQMLTLAEHLRVAVYEARIVALLVSVLGGLGLLLATVGLYGVIACLVTRRSREIGIRIAIGASPRKVLGAVLLRGLALAGAGLVLGAGGAVALGGALRSVLVGVTALDPWTHVVVALLILAVSAAASYAPARRAAGLDPVRTLRAE
jgi:predicted permease